MIDENVSKISEVSIVLSGAAGQGIQAVEHILTRVAKGSGFHIFATKEYMSRVRGGNTQLPCASQRGQFTVTLTE